MPQDQLVKFRALGLIHTWLQPGVNKNLTRHTEAPSGNFPEDKKADGSSASRFSQLAGINDSFPAIYL